MKKALHVFLKVSINMMHEKVVFFLGSKALYVVMMLVHLLPDTRTAVNTNRIVTFINVRKLFFKWSVVVNYIFDRNIVTLRLRPKSQPLILVRGTAKQPKEGYLVSEKLKIYQLTCLRHIMFIIWNIAMGRGISTTSWKLFF